ncbi:MAG: NAD-dependent epimerase/dehydratase family protein, partial [bacterium]
VRIFNTYGPRMRKEDGRVVSTFLTQALLGESLSIFGDGSQTRSFCYVSDEVDGIIRLLESNEIEPTNIGNPGEMTVSQLAELVKEITGSNVEIIYRDLPVDDPKVRQPDISKARRILKWEPRVDVREGLRLTMEYFKKSLGIA